LTSRWWVEEVDGESGTNKDRRSRKFVLARNDQVVEAAGNRWPRQCGKAKISALIVLWRFFTATAARLP
jgi:hypothetical protein